VPSIVWREDPAGSGNDSRLLAVTIGIATRGCPWRRWCSRTVARCNGKRRSWSSEAAHAGECQQPVGANPAAEPAPGRLGVDPQIGGHVFLPGLLHVRVEVTVQRPRPAGGERGQVGAQHAQNGPVAGTDQVPPSVLSTVAWVRGPAVIVASPVGTRPPTVCPAAP